MVVSLAGYQLAIAIKRFGNVGSRIEGAVEATSPLPEILVLETTLGLEAGHPWAWFLWQFVTPF